MHLQNTDGDLEKTNGIEISTYDFRLLLLSYNSMATYFA